MRKWVELTYAEKAMIADLFDDDMTKARWSYNMIRDIVLGHKK